MWEIYDSHGNRQLRKKESFDVHGSVCCMTFRTPPFDLL